MNYNWQQGWQFFMVFSWLSVYAMFAQTIITEKSERKLSISPQIGIAIFPSFEQKDKLGLPTNLFTAYGISPMIGVGLWYRIIPKLSLGTELNYLYAQRNTNSLGLLGTGIKLKYYIIKPRRAIAPYIFGGVNLWFANIDQHKQIKNYFPGDTSGAGQGIRTDQVDYKYNELNIFFAPIAGINAGAGLAIKINRRVSLFLQGSLQTSFATSELITNQFSKNNNAPLQYLSFQAGTNINFYKKVKFNIDTQVVVIPDAIAMLKFESDFDERNHLLGREGVFDVNLHEGMVHNLNVLATNHEINLELDESPCKKIAKLYDIHDVLIAQTEPDIHGKVNFTNLKEGKYKVILSLQPPCNGGDIMYHIHGNGKDIISQGNEIVIPDIQLAILSTTNKLIDEKINTQPKVLTLDLKMYKLYNLEGQISALDGWGFQVGAFRNLQNVVKMMQVLTQNGYEVYVQTIMLHDISVRFRSKENYKINRVIVFAGNNEKRSEELRQLLAANGYEIIVKEHFIPDIARGNPWGITRK